MRNVLYSLGIASFLVCMIFTVATSITNPFYGMSEAALGQATTYTTNSQSSNSGGTTFVYVFETKRFIVQDIDQYTTSESERYDSYDVGSELSGGYPAIFGASANIKRNSGFKSTSTIKTYNNATVCKDGGYSECYKSSSGGPTLFEWN